jgi:hypothetical protein
MLIYITTMEQEINEQAIWEQKRREIKKQMIKDSPEWIKKIDSCENLPDDEIEENDSDTRHLFFNNRG